LEEFSIVVYNLIERIAGDFLKIDILFLKDADTITIKDVKALINRIPNLSLGKNHLIYDHIEIDNILKLSLNNNYVSLTLGLDKNNYTNASVLSAVKDVITKGDHRAGYQIIISYDDTSKFFNGKLFVLISENEVKIRQLIYLILIGVFGGSWVDETIDEEEQGKLKENLRGGSKILLERALEGFTYNDYSDFLFKERPNKFTNCFIDQLIEELEKDEEVDKHLLISLLRENKSY